MKAQDILNNAAKHLVERGKQYDPLEEEERSMKEIVILFNTATPHRLCETDGWLFMVLLKLVRSRNGRFHQDSYEDMAAYVSLMGESHSKEESF